MAKIGDSPVAARYDGIPVGPRIAYSFETQQGIPVDGSNELLRRLSPFTLRILPPDSLFTALGISDNGLADTAGTQLNRANELAVDLVTAAALGTLTSNVLASELGRVTSLGNDVTLAQMESFVAGNGFLTDNLSNNYPTIADVFTAVDVGVQLQYLLDAEPLTLLINPKEMSINYTNIQNYSTRTRFGFVFERWGEEQPAIQFSGTTGGFMAGVGSQFGTDPVAQGLGNTTSSVSGLQAAARRDSAAWQNFTSLYHFYRNNGYIYDRIGKSEAHQFVGAIAIDYDQWTYVGHIESFEYTFDENLPHRVEWSMEFKVGAMFDTAESSLAVLPQAAPTASPSDPKYSGRGSSGTGGNTFAEAASRLTSTFQDATDADSEFGSIPFELLV